MSWMQFIPAIMSAASSLEKNISSYDKGATKGENATLDDQVSQNMEKMNYAEAMKKELQDWLRSAGETFNNNMQRNTYSTLTDPSFYGQKNASSSNASLDNSLGKEARKTAGVAEGGATPQLDNTLFSEVTGVKRNPTATQQPKNDDGIMSMISSWFSS